MAQDIIEDIRTCSLHMNQCKSFYNTPKKGMCPVDYELDILNIDYTQNLELIQFSPQS